MSLNDTKLKDLLTDAVLIDEDQYRDDFGPAEIGGWDSLGTLAIATAIKEQFGQEIGPEELVRIQSIGDIKSILRERGIVFA